MQRILTRLDVRGASAFRKKLLQDAAHETHSRKGKIHAFWEDGGIEGGVRIATPPVLHTPGDNDAKRAGATEHYIIFNQGQKVEPAETGHDGVLGTRGKSASRSSGAHKKSRM